MIGAYFVAIVVVQPAVGALGDRWGRRRVYTLSIAAFAAGSVLCTVAPTMTLLIGGRVVQGLGMGISMMPTTVAAMNVLPGRFVAQASSVTALNRQISGALGTAFLAALLVAALGSVSPEGPYSPAEIAHAQDAYNHIFLTTACALAVAVVPALFLPGRRRMRCLQRQRAAEHEQKG